MRPATIAAIFAVFCTVVAEGQSKNPFGIPSADTPQPGSAVKAAPGSRAQGWLDQGRSEVVARLSTSCGELNRRAPRRCSRSSQPAMPN